MGIRMKNIFDPNSESLYKLSRSQIELFVNCARCFYLDRRLGVARVSGPGFTLNSATDTLLKKEFDNYRTQQAPHPLVAKSGLSLIPYSDPRIEDWRTNARGVQFHLPGTTFLITGALDDLWFDPTTKQIHVVDYKSTSTKKTISLEDHWKAAYKRQAEVYQWLLRKNGLPIHNRSYFVYVNGLTSPETFDNRLEFDMQLLSYDGDDSWVESTVVRAWECLRSDIVPASSGDCQWCSYRDDALRVLG